MKGKGNFRISRDMRSNRIHIYLEDELSGVTFLAIEMSPEALGKALTNHYTNECEYTLQALGVIGKKEEIKHEIVTMPPGSRYTDEEKAQAVKPFEVDGWMAKTHVIGNHHYEVEGKRGSYRVVFIRFVEVEEDSNAQS
jgi:hypothetical protein